MTFDSERRKSFRYDHRRLPPNALRQRAWGGVTLVAAAALCAWTLCSTFADTGSDQIDLNPTRGDKLDVVVGRSDKLVILKQNAPALDVALSPFDSRFSLGLSPGAFAKSTPVQNDGNLLVSMPTQPSSLAAALSSDPTVSHGERIGQKAILPRPRPASAPQTASDAPPDRPSIFATIFAKLFGKPAPVKLAYAATDDAGLGVDASGYDQWTAVYDVSAHTVYMPDGTRLEAHSGLGSLLDDPRHADEKMRGATPPNVYDLELREELFHGVRALRLIPKDEQKVFGRAGLLAHTFMLGPNGDSNGCVSIRKYDIFLQAYLDRKIKRLVVVASL
jgi:Tlde1 domain